MKEYGYYMFTGIFFLLMAVAHGLRLILGWDFVYGEYTLPELGSIGIIVLCVILASRAFRAIKEIMP